MQNVDADELDYIIHTWLAEHTDPGAIAVDGKTLRGAKGHDGKQVHLLSAILHKEGVVVSQTLVDRKTNEITMFQSLLNSALIKKTPRRPQMPSGLVAITQL